MRNLGSKITNFVSANKYAILLATGILLITFGTGMQVGISAVLKAISNSK